MHTLQNNTHVDGAHVLVSKILVVEEHGRSTDSVQIRCVRGHRISYRWEWREHLDIAVVFLSNE